jgi:ferrous iron transport protein A
VFGQTLDSLAPGACARVIGFASADRLTTDRLLELGFDEGAEVEALHRAPLGDPIAVRVDGSVVALRRALARIVLLADAE